MLLEERLPEKLLSLFHMHREFKVNSIHNIIKAKLSYSEGNNKKYLRQKDMQHFMMLKNNNFNCY